MTSLGLGGRASARRTRAAPVSRKTRCSQLSAIAALVVIVQAVLAMVGLSVHADWASRYAPTSRQMALGTSVCLLLIGLAMLALRRPRTTLRRTLGYVLAASAALVGAAAVAQELIASVHEVAHHATPSFGWMSPQTGLAVLLLALSLLAIDARAVLRWPMHEVLAIAAGFGAFFALLGYLYGIAELYWFSQFTAMSLPGAIAILIASTGVVLARVDRGLGGLLASDGLGGHVVRRLLPAAILIPTLLGLLRVAGEHMRFYDTELGTALLIGVTVLLFASATLWSSSALGRIDGARLSSMRELRDRSLALELERRRLRAVLDVLPLGVVIVDAAGRVLELSPEARVIWGKGMPIVAQESDYDRLRGWDTRTGRRFTADDWALVRAFARGERCTGQEVDIESFDGERKTILDFGAPIRDERGVVSGAVAGAIDITERKRGERELASLKRELEERVLQRTAELSAANAELEAFSYSVSHDLRAPLRWIEGFARALEEEHAGELGPQGREYLTALRESVQRMRELITSLLDLSRVMSRPVERERIDVSTLASELAGEIGREAPSRPVEWRIEPGMVIEADRRLFRIALDNLLRNAWKFSRDRDPAIIEVGIDSVAGERALFVRDNGVGFDPKYAAKLFQPFERLHPANQFEGTGIGLAVVRRIVRHQGGRVWAESAPNRGATFHLTLAPRGAAETGAAP